MEKNVGGSAKHIKMCRGSAKKLKYVEEGRQIFPFRPPQDLKWNSPKEGLTDTGKYRWVLSCLSFLILY